MARSSVPGTVPRLCLSLIPDRGAGAGAKALAAEAFVSTPGQESDSWPGVARLSRETIFDELELCAKTAGRVFRRTRPLTTR